MTKEDDYACKHDIVVLFGNGKWQCTLCMLEFRPAVEPEACTCKSCPTHGIPKYMTTEKSTSDSLEWKTQCDRCGNKSSIGEGRNMKCPCGGICRDIPTEKSDGGQ